jgi:hypothetical protein
MIMSGRLHDVPGLDVYVNSGDRHGKKEMKTDNLLQNKAQSD